METAVGVLPAAVCAKKEGTDSPGCGRATAVAAVHRTVAKSCLSNPVIATEIQKRPIQPDWSFMVGEDGFARLRPGHGGCSSPLDCCQEPPFESVCKTKEPTSKDVSSFVVGEDGFASLRRSHGGCNSPLDCCQEPPFESGNCNGNTKKTNPIGLVFHGGGGRIRTIEAKRSRFTVCPLWPLGNSPIFIWLDWSR